MMCPFSPKDVEMMCLPVPCKPVLEVVSSMKQHETTMQSMRHALVQECAEKN